MPHVFIPVPWGEQRELGVTDQQRHHLSRVLRRAGGDPVTYTDGRGVVGAGAWTGDGVERGAERTEAPPDLRLRIAVAPPRAGERQRFLVEKVGELGTSEICWLATVHGSGRVPRPDRSSAWAVAALEQSRGAYLMTIGADEAVLSELAPPLLVADPAGRPLRQAFPERSGTVTVAIGPEGGFAPGEVPGHAEPLSLGSRVLRVETAAIAAATLMLVNT